MIFVGVLADIGARVALGVGPVYVETVSVPDASECLTGNSGPDWLKGDRRKDHGPIVKFPDSVLAALAIKSGWRPQRDPEGV